MKIKNVIKKFTAISSAAILASSMMMNAFAANYCDKQDNKEAPYISYFSNPDKVDLTKIDQAKTKAKITVDKVEVTPDMAGEVVPVNFNISDVRNKASAIGLITVFDTRLEIIPYYDEEAEWESLIKKGDALTKFRASYEPNGDGELFFSAISDENIMKDGVLFTVSFKIPMDAKVGDLYPVGVEYRAIPGVSNNILYNCEQDNEGALMNAWTWMYGVTNGYIKVINDITYGDANDDGEVTIDDAVLIMQALANPDKYGVGGTDENAMTEKGKKNADCFDPGSDLTAKDALAVQRFLLKSITELPEK